MNSSLNHYQSTLDWIATQSTRMIALVKRMAEINSHSENLDGLEQMRIALKEEFAKLPNPVPCNEYALEPQLRIDDQGERILVPLGKLLSLEKKGNPNNRSVLLSGHMDTVFRKEGDFQQCQQGGNRLVGPGVSDLKGGLVVMLLALEAFERSPFASELGWEVLINPDEEIGSTGSAPFLRQSAKKHRYGLVFEPALPDGSYVSARRGSATYVLTARGKSSHAGRDFHSGRNALLLLLPIMQQLAALSDKASGTTLNLGGIHSGGPVNIIPDLAVLRFGLRAVTQETMKAAQERINEIIDQHCVQDGDLQLVKISERPPKPFDAKTEQYFQQLKSSATSLGITMHWQESGGVCDGNLLSAEGLPTIDTLGPVGGGLHTTHEYIELDSLVPRAQLAALILMRVASGVIP